MGISFCNGVPLLSFRKGEKHCWDWAETAPPFPVENVGDSWLLVQCVDRTSSILHKGPKPNVIAHKAIALQGMNPGMIDALCAYSAVVGVSTIVVYRPTCTWGFAKPLVHRTFVAAKLGYQATMYAEGR